MDPQNRKKLINRAIAAYGVIHPCEGRSLLDCFTVQDGLLMFWFNDAGGNTHAVMHPATSEPALLAAAS